MPKKRCVREAGLVGNVRRQIKKLDTILEGSKHEVERCVGGGFVEDEETSLLWVFWPSLRNKDFFQPLDGESRVGKPRWRVFILPIFDNRLRSKVFGQPLALETLAGKIKCWRKPTALRSAAFGHRDT